MTTAFRLSLVAALLAAAVSAAGLFLPDLYQDSHYLQTLWRGNDLVTLAVVLPALALSLLYYKRGGLRVQLIWMGLLLYLFYNYAFYLFAAAFNAAFLLYVALFTLSAFALIYGLSGLPVSQLHFRRKFTAWIAAYLLLIALILSMVEIPPILAFMTEGKVPELIEQTGHPTSIVYALDLSIVVPLSVLAAVWLWQGKKWGCILAAMMLVKGVTYGLVLSANSVIIASSGIGSDPLLPFYAFVVLGGLGGLYLLLKNVELQNTGTDERTG